LTANAPNAAEMLISTSTETGITSSLSRVRCVLSGQEERVDGMNKTLLTKRILMHLSDAEFDVEHGHSIEAQNSAHKAHKLLVEYNKRVDDRM